MSKILFIEGVSGVGKSTMVRTLQENLQNKGYTVKSYVEFDYKNPIDFYCTAYIPNEYYRELCSRYSQEIERITRYSIPAGKATLVRYYNEDKPLFSEPLLGELKKMEFCYNPPCPVDLTKYTDAYRIVWKMFNSEMDGSVDYYIFDGSLLHHPLNDMIRNYHASPEQTATHVRVLIKSIVRGSWYVFYLFSEDIADKLRCAHQNRRQKPPDDNDIAFWKTRSYYDVYVLQNSVLSYKKLNISKYGYDAAFEQILMTIQ